jgi:hypothetical protein
MRENLPVFSHRGAAHGAAPLLVFPLFGFAKCLLLATFGDAIARLACPGEPRPPMPRVVMISSWV